MTTKDLCYIQQIRNNAVREQDFIKMEHIKGKDNLSNIFTKEDHTNVFFF